MIDKKKAVSEILIALKSKKKPDSMETESDDEEPEEASDEGKESAADDVLSAIQARDPKALAEALEAFFSMC